MMLAKSQGDTNSSAEDEDFQDATINKRPISENKKEPKQKRVKNLYRQPTTAELNQLHETENLFNSNLFRLQINEILQEVKIKDKTAKRFKIWFENIRNYLLAIPENDTEYDLSDPQLQKELRVKVPLNKELEKTKVSFKFHKYSDVSVVGSYKYECAINSKLSVDIELTMPADTFTKNDSINYRYHKKRMFYLAFIASHLSQSDIVEDIQYKLMECCESKPIIELKPSGKLSSILSVRIHLVCAEDSFKLARFGPNRNNLRESWLFSDSVNETNHETGPPTPYYNASVLQDLTQAVNHNYLMEVLDSSDNLKHAIVLLKIWLRQRNLAVSGYIVNMLVAYLVQVRRINNVMSSYQIVRNVWIYISSSDWDTKGISLLKGEAKDAPAPEDYLKTDSVVFLDKTGFYNICWRMTKGTYASLKIESSLAVKMLDNPNINSFIPLFMTTQKLLLQFDHILRFKDVSSVKPAVYNRIKREDKINYGLDKTKLVVKKIYDVLFTGFGKRVDLMVASTIADFSWPVKESLKKASKIREEEITFGFRLNAEEALNTIEKGPPANLPEAEEFRAFWGDKSELRRFQDGSITETCVWEGATLAERRLVVKQIVCYLMKLKFGIEEHIFYIADQLDSVLACKQHRPAEFEYGTGEEATVRLMQAFDSLRKDLRNLTDLPLHINSVYGTSAVFSYADPLPPLPHPAPRPTDHWNRESCCLIKDGQNDKEFEIRLPPYIRAATAVIEFGHSGKWPGTLEAFKRLKAAFNVQIAENLAAQFALSTHAHPGHVLVAKDGYVFRLEIAHQKEINLMKRSIEDGVAKYRDTEESIDMECRMILMPRLRGALHGLHQNHPAFGPCVSLAKRWLSAQLLDAWHFPHVAVELLAAHVFLQPEPYAPPAQPAAAFLALLSLLASADWNTQPLLLNFNSQLKREEIVELERRFAEERAALPALFAATPFDVGAPSACTRRAPTRNVLARARALAAAALAHAERALLRDSLDNVLGIFVPTLEGYDVLIRLRPELVPHRAELVSRRSAPRPLAAPGPDAPIPIVDFNPVERYLDELRIAYGEFALFFHDMYGGDVIAVLWRPELTAEQDFQVSKSNGVKPVSLKRDSSKCVVNVDALIEDFKIIGEGLVKEVTTIS